MRVLGADFGFDSHPVRGGNQMSEVSLADTETSVFWGVLLIAQQTRQREDDRALTEETEVNLIINYILIKCRVHEFSDEAVTQFITGSYKIKCFFLLLKLSFVVFKLIQ